jgi:pimeloyl-ACP methyl ester carboxylesterase
MGHTGTRAIPDIRLSRRAAIGRLTAAAVTATSPLAVHQASARPNQSSFAATQEGTTMTQSTPATNDAAPTVVLVHGAFADGSGWSGVIATLAESGLSVVAPPNPLRGISHDAAYIASFVQQIEGPVLLVGHSYGGAVNTNAASQTDNVVGLVYVGAFLPDDGETLQGLAEQATDSMVGPALRPAPYPSGDGATTMEFSLDTASFHDVFCADVPDAEAVVMATTQRPLSELAFSEPTRNPAWKTLPSWAIFGAADLVIGVTGLRAMAERANADTVEVDGASHVVMISQPEAVTDVILAAVDAVSTVGAAT